MSATLELPILPSAAASGITRFHLSLNVSDLDRTIAFLKTLLGREPAKCRPDYAKFELENPPLVLSLEPLRSESPIGVGSLNHLGFRMPDSAALVEVQRRLELAGIATKREEGVECCYARQTKFWVHDPDGNLWEIYTLDEDLEHRGAGKIPVQAEMDAGPTPALWAHRLGQVFPNRLPILDGTVDQIALEGTFNERHASEEWRRRIAEMLRILKPGGLLTFHGLTTDRALGDEPLHLPGPAAAVQAVPVEQELLADLIDAGFLSAQITFRATHACLDCGGSELRETRLSARAPQS